jgi:hypothetical protein
VEADQPGRAELGFDKGLPALKRVVSERLQTIATYGCNVVDISQLVAATGAALPRTEVRETHRAEDVVAHSEAGRKVVRHEAGLISAGDVLAAHSQGVDLQCAARTLVTPLARDLAVKYGVGIVKEER